MKALFYSIIVSAALAFSAEAVLVDGYCYLQEQTNHQDTKVKFQADSPSAVTDSTYTNADGYYQINLSLGVYDVYFSHQGYFDEQILDQLLSTATTLPNVTLTGGGIPISGPLNGILAGDTTYIVISDISVLSGSSLIIQAGATLIFNNGVNFNINGNLHAAGSETDSIKFINRPGMTWGGIDFNDSSSDSSKLEYCFITGSSSSGISCDYSSPSISNCAISGNTSGDGGGIYCYPYSSPSISNCAISGNTATYGGGGIFCNLYSSPAISACAISGNTASGNWNGGGISCYSYSSPSISNCAISGNTANYNGGGIYCQNNSSPAIRNTIVEGNYGNRGVYLDNSPNTTIAFSDFYNNQGGNFYNPPQWVGIIVITNANGDSCDVFYNIFLDPLFYSTTGDSAYYLTANSPCIDAGDPNSPFDPDNTIADIGAFYFDQSVGVVNPNLNFPVLIFNLAPAYPNPFNASTAISYQLLAVSRVNLSVYDITGREVAKLVDGMKPAGSHQVIFDAEGLTSGVYFARLTTLPGAGTRQHEMVRKVLLVK